MSNGPPRTSAGCPADTQRDGRAIQGLGTRNGRSHRPKMAISFFIAPAGLREVRMQSRKIREQHVAVNSLAGGSFWRRQAPDIRRAEC